MERVVVDPLLTERVALERLVVAGATLLTEEVLLVLLPATLRLEVLLVLLPATLRLELLPATLRLELLPATLRLDDEPATLRLEVEASPTDLDAMPDEAGATLRLALVPNCELRLVVLRLRLRSHPPPLMLRLGTYRSTRLVLTDTYAG